MGKLVVLNPVSAPVTPLQSTGPRLADLAGRRVGFFANGKPNAEVILRRVAERLTALHGVVAQAAGKAVPSLAAPAEALGALAACDAVVLAVGD